MRPGDRHRFGGRRRLGVAAGLSVGATFGAGSAVDSGVGRTVGKAVAPVAFVGARRTEPGTRVSGLIRTANSTIRRKARLRRTARLPPSTEMKPSGVANHSVNVFGCMRVLHHPPALHVISRDEEREPSSD